MRLTDYEQEKVRRLKELLMRAFIWSATEQGHYYWEFFWKSLDSLLSDNKRSDSERRIRERRRG